MTWTAPDILEAVGIDPTNPSRNPSYPEAAELVAKILNGDARSINTSNGFVERLVYFWAKALADETLKRSIIDGVYVLEVAE